MADVEQMRAGSASRGLVRCVAAGAVWCLGVGVGGGGGGVGWEGCPSALRFSMNSATVLRSSHGCCFRGQHIPL